MNSFLPTSQFLNLTRNKRVLVIGDVMIDQYLSGSVSRISPEAPVPILLHQETTFLPGGAANVALNLAGLESEVWLASAIGADEMGNLLKEILSSKNIHTDLLLTDTRQMTTCKTRIMAGNQHLLRVDQEKKENLPSDLLVHFLKMIERLLEEKIPDIAVLQDYNKGILTAESIPAILELLQKYQVPVAVDPKFENFYAYQGVTIFKPNLTELRVNVPFKIQINESSLLEAAAYLRSRLHCQLVLITLSERGVFIDDGNNHSLIPAEKRLIADVCGAGDTVISVASLAYVAGLQLKDIAYWSSYCGTLVCQYPGVKPITREMLGISQ
jgi:D-glycero-beta-D-manno-heptose-7-phosphate kinase